MNITLTSPVILHFWKKSVHILSFCNFQTAYLDTWAFPTHKCQKTSWDVRCKMFLKIASKAELPIWDFFWGFHAWWEVFKIELNPAFETVWQINIQASQIYLTFNFRQTSLILWTTNRQTKIYLYLKVSIQSLPKDLHNSVRQTSWKFKILPIVCRQHGDIKLATCYGHLFSLHTHS